MKHVRDEETEFLLNVYYTYTEAENVSEIL